MRRFQILFFTIGLIFFIDHGSYFLKASRASLTSVSHEMMLLADPGESETEENETSVYLFAFKESFISAKFKMTTEHQQYPLSVCDIEVPIPPPRE